MNKLVIVESPNKIKSIQSYLGDEYKVMSSVGHIVKLPSTGELGLGIDLINWEPKYSVDPKKKKVVKELKDEAKKSDIVYVATDPDREGEAIADNLVSFLEIPDKYKRIRYNEITRDAILEAMKNPQEIDTNLVNAQKARRMLDRIIGYRLSKLISSKISSAPARPSAGRVQSVALKLVINREDEVTRFVPITFFNAFAKITDKISAQWFDKNSKLEKKEWIMPEDIDKVFNSLNGPLKVQEVKKGKRTSTIAKPFKQSALYKTMENEGISSLRTQSILQKLYEGFDDGGLISYPRTDSTRLSNTFVAKVHTYLRNKFGQDYVNNKIKGEKGAQDAHEAIRPTDITLTPEIAEKKYNLNLQELKVYRSIYFQTIKALMSPPIHNTFRYVFENNGNTFKISTSNIFFDGYYKVIGHDKFLELPEYSKNQIVDILEYTQIEGQTKPPPRYTEGALIEKLDEIGVGRPSTYAAMIKKIKDRKYVEKEENKLIPTEYGRLVNQKLLKHFRNIVNEEYTAKIEKELDNISSGKHDYKETMKDFYGKFADEIDQAFSTMEFTKILPIPTGDLCPECSSALVHRKSKKGSDFIGCSNFPNCRYIKKEEIKKTGNNCPKCSSPLVYRKNNKRGTEFIGCSNFPKCKYIEKINKKDKD